MVTVVDSDGVETVASGEPVTVPCNVHPTSANEADTYGLVLTDSYRITCAPGLWPGEPRSKVVYAGEEFFQVGRTRISRLGRATQADRVFIQRGQRGDG